MAAGKSSKSRKQKRNAKQLYADLAKPGYGGSYSRVAALARRWRIERQYEQQTSGRGTFVPLVFQPGEAFQFEWSEDYAVLGGNPRQHTGHRLSPPHIDEAAANFMLLAGRSDTILRTKRIPQYRQLLLNGSAPPA